VAFPCGLVAKSFFNDTFNISTPATPAIDVYYINQTDIAWESDKLYKFKNSPLA
jgi:hypothetical protein